MQDDPDDAYDDSREERGQWLANLARWVGALLSVAILSGVAVWTYRLGARDARAVPVIAALEGPAKVQPEDPGGRRAENQGLTVSRVMEGPPPPPRPATITLAPPPAEPEPEDVPAKDLPPLVPTEAPRAVPAPPADSPLGEPRLPGRPETPIVAEGVAPAAPGPILPATRSLSLPADWRKPEPDAGPGLAEGPAPVKAPATPPEREAGDLAGDSEESEATGTALVVIETAAAEAPPVPAARRTATPPVAATAAPEALPPAAAAPSAPPPAPPTAQAPEKAGPPPRRPATLAASRTEAAAPVPAALTTGPAPAAPAPAADPAVPPKGTILVQLGAFESVEVARSEWDKLLAQHRDLLGTRGPLIQRATPAGRVFFRLRAEGFADLAEARALCSALTARGVACITARQE